MLTVLFSCRQVLDAAVYMSDGCNVSYEAGWYRVQTEADLLLQEVRAARHGLKSLIEALHGEAGRTDPLQLTLEVGDVRGSVREQLLCFRRCLRQQLLLGPPG